MAVFAAFAITLMALLHAPHFPGPAGVHMHIIWHGPHDSQ